MSSGWNFCTRKIQLVLSEKLHRFSFHHLFCKIIRCCLVLQPQFISQLMINSRIHGILDYITVLFFALAPSLFALSETGATISYVLAIVHLLMTLVTGFSMSLIKVIPYRIHGFVEYAVGIVLLVVPWLLQDIFTTTDQYFFSIVGAVILLVAILSTYKSPLHDWSPIFTDRPKWHHCIFLLNWLNLSHLKLPSSS